MPLTRPLLKFINLKPKSYSLTACKYSFNTKNHFLAFYFKITADSQAFVRNNTEWTCVLIQFPFCGNYSTLQQPHSDFTSLYTLINVCVFSFMQLYPMCRCRTISSQGYHGLSFIATATSVSFLLPSPWKLLFISILWSFQNVI